MATQTQSRSHSRTRKSVRCDMCYSQATRNHFVEAAGGILNVCNRCDFILDLKDRIAELETELAQHKADKTENIEGN